MQIKNLGRLPTKAEIDQACMVAAMPPWSPSDELIRAFESGPGMWKLNDPAPSNELLSLIVGVGTPQQLVRLRELIPADRIISTIRGPGQG